MWIGLLIKQLIRDTEVSIQLRVELGDGVMHAPHIKSSL
jgi:hypothetical protein